MRRYVLITPARDEAEYARRTLDSIAAQTVPPALWIVVDDGSTDDTPRILAEYASRMPYLKIITRHDRGERKVGPGVIDAFYEGYSAVDSTDFAYICKFDLDLDLPPRYFELLMERMEADPRIGTCSGKPYFAPQALRGEPAPPRDALLRGDAFDTAGLVSEACGDEMSVGMIKFYRRECFTQIGGFVREVMWDGIDCHRCRMLGWKALSWDDPGLRFLHLRPMGSSHRNILTGRLRHGYGQYFMGTSLAYMTASAAFRMTRPPVLIGGAAMWWGYVRSMLGRAPRYDDAEFRRFLRHYQWACLLKGKARATKEVDDRQRPRWSPRNDPASDSRAAGLAAAEARL